MADLLLKLADKPATNRLLRALGLPTPVELARAPGGYVEAPLRGKTVALGASPDGFAHEALRQAIEAAGAQVLEVADLDDDEDDDDSFALDVVVLDATGCTTPERLEVLYQVFHPLIRQIARNARVLLVGPLLGTDADPVAQACVRGLEGFCRSLGKELGKRGATVNLAYVARDALDRLSGVLRFFGGVQSTYVSGQTVRVTAEVAPPPAAPFVQALAGKVALVTGSARGIGAATAERLAQEGARVVCLDVPAARAALEQTCAAIGATPFTVDIADDDAPRELAAFLQKNFGGVDIVVHNAGITRDRTLRKMKQREWQQVLDVNFAAVAAIDAQLLAEGVLREQGRIVCLSSISGIAGNAGQTNYATSKAALIGYVAAQAPRLAARGICINAVAPGFIETAMTDAMPFLPREVGRRLNAVNQSGRPRDVAELITFLCTPGACGISGQTIRVCGLGLIGA